MQLGTTWAVKGFGDRAPTQELVFQVSTRFRCLRNFKHSTGLQAFHGIAHFPQASHGIERVPRDRQNVSGMGSTKNACSWASSDPSRVG